MKKESAMDKMISLLSVKLKEDKGGNLRQRLDRSFSGISDV